MLGRLTTCDGGLPRAGVETDAELATTTLLRGSDAALLWGVAIEQLNGAPWEWLQEANKDGKQLIYLLSLPCLRGWNSLRWKMWKIRINYIARVTRGLWKI